MKLDVVFNFFNFVVFRLCRVFSVFKRQQQFCHAGSPRLHDAESLPRVRRRRLCSRQSDGLHRSCLVAGRVFERLDELQSRRKPVDRLLSEGTGEHRLQGREMRPAERRHRFHRLHAGPDQPSAPQHLVNHGSQAEDIRAPIPGVSRDAFRRCVRPPDRRGGTDVLERPRNPNADDAGRLRREQDIPRIERAVLEVPLRGEVQAFSQLTRHAQRVDDGHLALLAHDDVERVAGEVILREIRDDAVEAGCDGRCQSRVSKSGFDQAFELGEELMNTFGRKVEPEDFDRHQAITIWFVRAKHRPQSTGTDLMKYSKWTEGV